MDQLRELLEMPHTFVAATHTTLRRVTSGACTTPSMAKHVVATGDCVCAQDGHHILVGLTMCVLHLSVTSARKLVLILGL